MTLKDAYDKHGHTKIGPAGDYIPITTFAASDLVNPTDGSKYTARALRCSCDGTATLKMVSGSVRTGVPLLKGDNAGAAQQVIAWTPDVVGGTIWGVI
jgi:hypothetical protein